MKKLISVLMCTYNEPEYYIRSAVESILKQTYKAIQFIIVIDNPANEEHIRICTEYGLLDKRIKVLINDKNMGLVKSLNRALQHAVGYYIARMDADDISCLSRFEKQIIFIEKYNLDLVGSNIREMDENGEFSEVVRIYPKTHNEIVQCIKTENVLAHPTWLGKREVFLSLKGYREIEACEDYDFLVRLILSNYRLGNVQEVLLHYRLNSKGISSTKKAIQKASFDIIRDSYKNGVIIPFDIYREYMNSLECRKKVKDLDKYYLLSYKFKRTDKKTFCSFFYIIYAVVATKEGKIVAINKLRNILRQK